MSVVPLKFACTDGGQYGLNVEPADYVDDGVRLLRTSDLSAGGAYRDTGIHIAGPLQERYLVRAGDLLLSRSGTVGQAFQVPTELAGCSFAGFLIRFRANARVADPRFLYYATQTQHFQVAVQADAVTSTISNFNAERYAGIRIPLPPLDEQRRIANYLDDQTTRIDQAIQLRQQQAKLVKTRSVAPLVPLLVAAHPTGNSAVSWLPVMGPGWKVQRLSRVAKCHDGRRVPLSSEERSFRQGQFPYYGASTVVDHIDDFIFDGEYVLIGEDGAALERQDFDVVQEPAGRFWVNNHAHVLEGVSVTNSYLAEILRCVDRPLLVSGATRPKITQDDLMALRIPVPPQAEQVQLADACKEIRKSNLYTLKSLELAIAKLQELRNSMISSAVSGELVVSSFSLGS